MTYPTRSAKPKGKGRDLKALPANTDHEVVKDKQPETSAEMKIWRYIKLPSLISLLQTRTLHFAKLGALQDDLFEGTLSTITQLLDIAHILTNFPRSAIQNDLVGDKTKFVREYTYVNCWSGNQKESAAMWRLYGTSQGSVAIQSTYDKLVAALPDTYFVGMVKYLDYDHEHFPTRNSLYLGFHKRIEFKFEEEVRALKQVLPRTEDEIPTLDLNFLIEKIYLRSSEESWIKDVVKGIWNQHSLETKLVPSSIDAQPPSIQLR